MIEELIVIWHLDSKEMMRLLEKLEKNANFYIANHMEAALYFELCATQKLRYFLNLFIGQEKYFHGNYVQAICNNFEEAYVKNQKEFSTITRQKRIKKCSQTLSLTSFMKQKSYNVSKALGELRDVSTKLTTQSS